MTPAARIAAAIEILDTVLAGAAAEQALTRWARGSRFAGSRDRAAIRDHVFDALRCLRSFTAFGGGATPTGRALMLGLLRAAGSDPAEIFSGDGYGPSALTAGERTFTPPALADLSRGVARDCPDWLLPEFDRALGDAADAVLDAMRLRAPTIVRVNARRATRDEAARALATDGISSRPHDLARFALQAIDNAQKIKTSGAYLSGLVELQDAAPQAAVETLPLRDGMRVLDLCAGGGGKTLAMAANADVALFAHDAAPQRMADLSARAARASIRVTTLATADLDRHGPFDLVLTDVPCSGTGTWRRAPEAKWALTPARLAALTATQDAILARAATLVGAGGWLVYMTCSLLRAENRDRIDSFLKRHPGFTAGHERLFSPLDAGDGFYAAHLRRD
jgi:16S rRNA (cytosine967-C5)-methyltransferase